MSDEIKKRIALEGLTRVNDRCGVFHGRIEDLMFRAQRIASRLKTNQTIADFDFDSDLKRFRADLKKLRFEMEEVLLLVRALKDEDLKAVSSHLVRLHGRLDGLAEYVALAHQRMPRPDYRLEAWYCIREVNDMIDFLLQKDVPRQEDIPPQ